MTKRTIVTACVVVSFFAASLPAFAQSVTPTQPSGGFFGGIRHFFSTMFHRQEGETESVRDDNAPTGTVPETTGTPDRMKFEQARLDGFVRAGKITQAQETAILAELQKVQTELKTWADSQGIDEAIVLGGGLGPMMERAGQDDREGGVRMGRPNTQATPVPGTTGTQGNMMRGGFYQR